MIIIKFFYKFQEWISSKFGDEIEIIYIISIIFCYSLIINHNSLFFSQILRVNLIRIWYPNYHHNKKYKYWLIISE